MRKADNLPPSCAVVTKSGNLNYLEPSGPVEACTGHALPYDAHNKQLLISCTTVTGRPTVSNCVLCEVKTEARVLPQAASRRPLTGEARVQSQLSLCEVCGAQSGTTPDFCPSTSFFPLLNHSAIAPY